MAVTYKLTEHRHLADHFGSRLEATGAQRVFSRGFPDDHDFKTERHREGYIVQIIEPQGRALGFLVAGT